MVFKRLTQLWILAPRSRTLFLLGIVLLIAPPVAVKATAQEPPPPFLLEWGTLGSGDGQFSSPFGVAVDASGNVYVADLFNHRIQTFGYPDSDGDGVADATDLCPGTPAKVVDTNGCSDNQVDPDADGALVLPVAALPIAPAKSTSARTPI